MKTHDFWYDLPEELIAQTPLEKRDTSRLLVMDRQTGEVKHQHFYDIIDYLRPGDCLVMNDSRVLPARLLGHRPTGGTVELLLSQLGPVHSVLYNIPRKIDESPFVCLAVFFGDYKLSIFKLDQDGLGSVTHLRGHPIRVKHLLHFLVFFIGRLHCLSKPTQNSQ